MDICRIVGRDQVAQPLGVGELPSENVGRATTVHKSICFACLDTRVESLLRDSANMFEQPIASGTCRLKQRRFHMSANPNDMTFYC